VRTLQQHLKYQAAGEHVVDVIDVYTTDGHILKYGLVVLDDDRSFFPPYSAAPLINGRTARAYPEVVLALGEFGGVLTEERMRAWNLELQEKDVSVEAVARTALAELGLVDATLVDPNAQRPAGFFEYLWKERRALLRRIGEHLALVGTSLAAAVLVSVPLGLALERRRRLAEWVIRAVGVLQTIPSIALLAFFIPFLGVGAKPAIAALFLYALLPIVRNTYTGVRDADPAAVEAAFALGMTPTQILTRIRLPLSTPILLAGVRTAAVINVGTATLAAFIGAGGLGEPIVTGLQLSDTRMILSGALPAAVLAIVVDGILALIESQARPKGLAGHE
jgi:osmoprotectant transport system permease protein